MSRSSRRSTGAVRVTIRILTARALITRTLRARALAAGWSCDLKLEKLARSSFSYIKPQLLHSLAARLLFLSPFIPSLSLTSMAAALVSFPPLRFVVVQSPSEWGTAGIISGVDSHQFINMNVRPRHKSRIASLLSAEGIVRKSGCNRQRRAMLIRPAAC